MRKLLILTVAATLSACAVGPNYQRPVTPVDPQFVNAGQPGFNGSEVISRLTRSLCMRANQGLTAARPSAGSGPYSTIRS